MLSMDEVGWDADDASPAIAEAFRWVKARGSKLSARGGNSFVIKSDLAFDLSGSAGRLDLDFGGASVTFDTDQRIEVTGFTLGRGHRLAGLNFAHQAKYASMECCLDIFGTAWLTVEDITSDIYDRPEGWSLIRVRQGTNDDAGTGAALWTRIYRTIHRPQLDGYVDDNDNPPPEATVRIVGQCNDTSLLFCDILGSTNGLVIEPCPGFTATSNTTYVFRSTFEGMGRQGNEGSRIDPGYAVKIKSGNSGEAYVFGPFLDQCRYEGMAGVFDLSECTATDNRVKFRPSSSRSTSLATSVPTFALDPHGVGAQCLDFFGIESSWPPVDLRSSTGVLMGGFTTLPSGVPAVQIDDPVNGHGLRLSSGGSTVLDMVRDGANLEMRRNSNIPASTMIGDGTPVRNAGGAASISAASSVVVYFPGADASTNGFFPEADTDFGIALFDFDFDPGSWWITAKDKNKGFTANFASAVTGNFRWRQHRTGQFS